MYHTQVREIRVLRREAAARTVSMALLKFGDVQQAAEFLEHYNGRPVRC